MQEENYFPLAGDGQTVVTYCDSTKRQLAEQDSSERSCCRAPGKRCDS